MWKSAIERMEASFSSAFLKRSHTNQLNGCVLNVRLSDGLLKARVKGDSNQLYNVFLDLKKWPAQPSRCGCRTQRNCEHAIAALFEIQAQKGTQPQPTSDYTSLHRAEENVLDAEDVEWFSSVEQPGNEFFSYQLGILIDGKQVSIVPLILDLIDRWDPKTLESLSDGLELKLPIEKGQVLKIKLSRIKPLLRLLFNYSIKNAAAEQVLKLKRYQLLLFFEAEQAVAATNARWQGTEQIKEKLSRLASIKRLPSISVPIGLQTKLREYQQEGLNWLQCLRSNEFGGVLADDMGLGKTIQTLALLQFEKEQGRLNKPCLIIAPTSLVDNWYDEAKRFTPELKVLIFHGAERHNDDFDNYDLIVSTYGVVQRDKRRFLKSFFYYLILDEAQFIKNARTKTTQIIQQLRGMHRLCLTGTPLENHLSELWSLFHFLMPGFLGNARQFSQHFIKPIEKLNDNEQSQLLAKRLQPFMLRRTKKDVLKELPEKTEIIRKVELTGPQRDLYEVIRLSMEKKVRDAIAKQGLGKSQIMLLDALLKLRQICCDPKLVSVPEAVIAHGSSAKMEALLDLLDNLMEEGRRVLIFSQFTSMLTLIEYELDKRQYQFLKLTGQTKNRSKMVNDFQSGKAPVFLISLKAGGTGLNLTRADTVIHYDPWWNPAAEDQATDRSHRIGQKKPVFVYKLITTGTVEETILKMQENKRQLVEGILTDKKTGGFILSEEELETFFKPLDE